MKPGSEDEVLADALAVLTAAMPLLEEGQRRPGAFAAWIEPTLADYADSEKLGQLIGGLVILGCITVQMTAREAGVASADVLASIGAAIGANR